MFDLLSLFTGLIAVGSPQTDLAARDRAASAAPLSCSFCASGPNRKKSAFTALFDDDLFDDDSDAEQFRSRDEKAGASRLNPDEPAMYLAVIKTSAAISLASIRLNLRI